MNNHTPISCELYDCLKNILHLKRQCCITYLDEEDKLAKIYGQIIFISAADGTDYCKLGNGKTIFLNKIESFESY